MKIQIHSQTTDLNLAELGYRNISGSSNETDFMRNQITPPMCDELINELLPLAKGEVVKDKAGIVVEVVEGSFDADARRAIVKGYSRLAHKVAASKIWALDLGVELHDITQGAFEGILRAIDTYEIDGGHRFVSWAWKYAEEYAYKAIESNTAGYSKLPRHQLHLLSQLAKLQGELEVELQRPATLTELATHINENHKNFLNATDMKKMSADHLERLLQTQRRVHLDSEVDDSDHRNHNEDENRSLYESIAGGDDSFVIGVEYTEIIETLTADLSDKERLIVTLDMQGVHNKEIAKLTGYARPQGVSNAIIAIHKKLRKKANSLGFHNLQDILA